MPNLDIPVWSNDGKQVCYRGKPIRGVDPKTFEVLLGNYARDAQSVFFHRLKAPVDRTTFRVLNANFGVDATQAYFVVSPIRDADPKSFRVLDSSLMASSNNSFLQAGFAADDASVWFASGDGIYQIKSADPKTFFSLGHRFGCDSERVYYERAMLPGIDRTTWRHWRGILSVDKKSVFFVNRKVADVDRASIKLLTVEDCFMDRHCIYCGDTVVSPEWYLEKMLMSMEAACARERDWLPSRKMFEMLLDESPQLL